MQSMFLRAWCETVNRWYEIKSGERGATAVEYGVMVALILAVIIVAVKSIGTKTGAAFDKVDTNLP